MPRHSLQVLNKQANLNHSTISILCVLSIEANIKERWRCSSHQSLCATHICIMHFPELCYAAGELSCLPCRAAGRWTVPRTEHASSTWSTQTASHSTHSCCTIRGCAEFWGELYGSHTHTHAQALSSFVFPGSVNSGRRIVERSLKSVEPSCCWEAWERCGFVLGLKCVNQMRCRLNERTRTIANERAFTNTTNQNP